MNIYDLSVNDQEMKKISLSEYSGKVLLIVNTATRCGFTKQYSALEALYRKYKDQGFVILDFPCNQFLHQAPGTDEEINSFCSLKYDTTFPRFHKINVNGKETDQLYVFLKTKKPGNIKWNFTKFLIDRNGEVVERYSPQTKPEDIEERIASLL